MLRKEIAALIVTFANEGLINLSLGQRAFGSGRVRGRLPHTPPEAGDRPLSGGRGALLPRLGRWRHAGRAKSRGNQRQPGLRRGQDPQALLAHHQQNRTGQ